MGDFLKEIEKRVLVHDGSKGYLLQKMGLQGGECGELWNITNKEAVRRVYRSYIEAGSDVIQTNTFPGNRLYLKKYSLENKAYEINYMGAKLAREEAGDNIFVSASIGPTGLLFEPLGDLCFDTAYEIFSEQVNAVVDGGADIINFETFTDIAELRAALLAAKDTTDIPVICSLAFESGGRTLMGTDPFVAVHVLKSLGADMIGTNCSFGPEHLLSIAHAMYNAGGGFLSIKPNAGLPKVSDGAVMYEESAEHFAEVTAEFVKYGARLLGGCCGTTPEYIKSLKNRVRDIKPATPKVPAKDIITSATAYLEAIGIKTGNTGEINATKDKMLLEALNKDDMSYVEDLAIDTSAEGYDALYINIDAATGGDMMLSRIVNIVQSYVKAPLIIESSNTEALKNALRIYRGVAGVKTNRVQDITKISGRYGFVLL